MTKISKDGFEAGVKFINNIHSIDKRNANEFTLYTIGGILLAEKKYDEAIEVFEMRSVFYPGEKDGQNLLAVCYLLKGDVEKAKRDFQDVLLKDSTNTKALEYLRLLHVGG